MTIAGVGLQLALMATANAEAKDTVSGYIDVGAAVMQRSQPNAGVIVQNNPGGAAYLAGDAFSFGWDTGVDAKAGISLLPETTLEMRYLGIKSATENTFTSPGNFIGVGFTGPGGTVFASTYETDLQSLEVNWRQQLFDRLTVLAGVRGMGITDELSTVLNSNVATGDYRYDNKYLGAQIGAEFALLEPSSLFQIGVSGKVGVFALKSEGGISEYSGSTFIGSFEGGDAATTYAAELGITAGYHFTDNIQLNAGYQLLWIDQVALASDNAAFSLTNPSLLNTTVQRDGLLYQGLKVGLNVEF